MSATVDVAVDVDVTVDVTVNVDATVAVAVPITVSDGGGRGAMAPFEAYEVALELAVAMGPVIERVGRRDRDMAGQMRRATQGVPSSLAEGARRAGQDRIQLFRIASGSAAEIRTLLILARAWGYLRPTDLEAVQPLLDRELAMLWRLTHPRT